MAGFNNVEKNVFSFDAETNGLWGKAFAIGAVLYKNGNETEKFYSRCQIEGKIDPWVEANVLPQMEAMPVTHGSYLEMLQAFSKWYLAHKDGADIIVHMGTPVESRVLIDMHSNGFIGDWDGPYPLIDVAGNLQQAGFNPTSVDSYNSSHGIVVPQSEASGTHNPLYDSRAAALCYMDLMKK